ncbi:MAG TPA: DUF938 domain-containing protein [Allosphingosinicella sp.]|nr:DUF938 domain-containing protein [Allosphingosinicella sp.]
MKRSAPATTRNREPIAAVLREALPESGALLEIASGSGEHAVYFAGRFPGLEWRPTDPDPDALASIREWRAAAGPDNLLEPLRLDASEETWPVATADAILCVNMVHISPWAATEGLMRGSGRLLASRSPLILYGPYRRSGVPTAPSNEAFDESLKARNPLWGLRDLEAVEAEAGKHGLGLERVMEMPANNLTLVFRR